MIIFNTTFNVELNIENEFTDYIKSEYIPVGLNDGPLSDPRLAEILSTQEDGEGKNFALQFNVENIDVLNEWYISCGAPLNNEMTARFGKSVLGFSTLMKEIPL